MKIGSYEITLANIMQYTKNLLLLNRKTHFCGIDAHQHIYVLVIIENTFSRIRNYICKEEHVLICVMESMSYDEMVR